MSKPYLFVLRNVKGSVEKLLKISTDYPKMTSASSSELHFHGEAEEQAVISWYCDESSDLLWYSLLGHDDKPEEERPWEDESDQGCPEEIEPAFYCLSIYMENTAYGGPEEGGWYYFTYEPLILEYGHLTKCFKAQEEAHAYMMVLDALCERLNKGGPDTSSVLSHGQYRVILDINEYPHAEPRQRPIYE